MVQAYGAAALPIITLDGELVSMGNATPEQAVLAIKEKMSKVK